MTERKAVILSDAERRNLRRKLKGSVEVTKSVLSPRNQVKRLAERSKASAQQLADGVANSARKNAPAIGIIGLATLLFAARRPIAEWISKARERKINPPTGD